MAVGLTKGQITAGQRVVMPSQTFRKSAPNGQPFETQLQATLNLIPVHTWYAASSGALMFVNARCGDYLGLPADHPLRFGIQSGAPWDSHISYVHPDDHDETRSVWSTSLSTGQAGEVSFRVRDAAGVYRWFLRRAEPLRTPDGTLRYWIGINLDIEDRRQAEFYLAEGQRLAHTGSWAFTPSGFDHWSTELFKIHGLDSGIAPSVDEYLGLVHPEDREFVAQEIQKMFAGRTGFDFAKRIVRPDGEIRHIRCVGVPSRSTGSQSFVGTGMDVTDQVQLTEEIKRREAYLAEAQRLSHTGSFAWKPHAGEHVWSDETYRIFEYEPSTRPTPEMALQRLHPDDAALARQVIERASAGTDFEEDFRLLMPAGAIKYIHVQAHSQRDRSGNMEFIGAVTDVTERKAAEDGIRQREAELRQVLDFTPQLIAVFGPDRQRLYANRGALDYLGVGIDEWRKRSIGAEIHPDDRGLLKAYPDHAFLNGDPYELELRLRKSDGSYRWFLARYNPVRDHQGQVVRLYVACTDIEHRKEAEDSLRHENVALKQAEEKIRQQEAELRQMLDYTPQLVAMFGPNRERLYVGRTALDYFGMSLEEWREGRDGEPVHPDDFARHRAETQRSLVIDTAYETELRLRNNDRSYRWFLARFNPVRDDEGRISRWYVACTDIDDRKRAEERLQRENATLREEIDQTSMFEEIVGSSAALQNVLSRISRVAPSDSTVLIAGETGTGKELIARGIHRRSNRKEGPFVSVNCAAIPRDLILSELFGHEKGAFTGATQRRIGRFELADGGTIFLDEVGELSPDTQVALLRVLQEREFERIGSGQSIRVDVRVIAATNRDLKAAIANGTFRPDLFYRLNVFPINVPPLRERKDDIVMLVEYFVQRYASKAAKNIRSIDKRTLEVLQSYDWPGNIRELQNIIERSVILSFGDTLSIDELWFSKEPWLAQSRVEKSQTLGSVSEPLTEREIIEKALAESRGRVSGPSGAAAKLGIPQSTLATRIKALKINKNQFKFRHS